MICCCISWSCIICVIIGCCVGCLIYNGGRVCGCIDGSVRLIGCICYVGCIGGIVSLNCCISCISGGYIDLIGTICCISCIGGGCVGYIVDNSIY